MMRGRIWIEGVGGVCYPVGMKKMMLVWLAFLCAGVVGAAVKLTAWTEAEKEINVLEAGTAYTATSASSSEDKVFIITSNGEKLSGTTTIDVSTYPNCKTTLRLRNVRLSSEAYYAIKATKGGTLIIEVEEGENLLAVTSSSKTEAWHGAVIVGDSAASIILRGAEGASLELVPCGTAAKAASAIYSPDVPVQVESGAFTLYGTVSTSGGTDGGYSVAPVINTKAFTMSGGRLTAGLIAMVSSTSAAETEAAATSVVTAETIDYQGGVVRSASKSLPSGNLTTFSYTSSNPAVYAYPEAAFTALRARATGGQIGQMAYFHFPQLEEPAEGEEAPDLTACFESSTASDEATEAPVKPTVEAVTIDYENKVVSVDTTVCAEPKVRYASANDEAAVALFDAVQVPTAAGVKADYAFGITWIAPVEVDSVRKIALKVAVDLPNESADARTFKIVISRGEGAAATPVYTGNVQLTRAETGSSRFVSGELITSDGLEALSSGTRCYRVQADLAAE